MMTAKVGHFQDGKFHELASGSEEYCRGFLDGYNLHSHVDATMLVGHHCQCGPDRVEVTTDAFPHPDWERRVGCSRCNRWDAPPRLKKNRNA